MRGARPSAIDGGTRIISCRRCCVTRHGWYCCAGLVRKFGSNGVGELSRSRGWPSSAIDVTYSSGSVILFRQVDTTVVPRVSIAAALRFKTDKRSLRRIAGGMLEK